MCDFFAFSVMTRHQPKSTLFPYTTLFRSLLAQDVHLRLHLVDAELVMHPQLNELIAHLAQLRGQRLGALLTLQVQLVPDLQEFLQAPTGEVLESRVVIHLIGSFGSGAFCCDAGRGGWGPDVLCLNIPPGPVCGRSSAPGASMSRKRSGPRDRKSIE